MKCYKGTILSVDASDGVYRYLVEDKGQILYVGNDLPSEYNMAEVIDLKGKAIVPAFVDTHQHFASLSTFNSGHQGLIQSRHLQTTASSFHWDPMPHALTPTLSSGFIGLSTIAILTKE